MGTKSEKKAREYGAAYKEGYPVTYTRSQTAPVYRKQRAAQERELRRLVYATGMPWGAAISRLRRKYDKAGIEFLPPKRPR